jgi:hypothetical protein
MKLQKSSNVLKLAIAFWTGIGLMSIINVWKITYTKQVLLYDWIMFGVSLIFIAMCFVILAVRKK